MAHGKAAFAVAMSAMHGLPGTADGELFACSERAESDSGSTRFCPETSLIFYMPHPASHLW